VCPYIRLENDNYTYYMVITHICVKFIVGQLKVEFIKRFQDKHHSVNATACEYLELMLRSSKDRTIATNVAHLIIDSILKTLF